jgi:hypothetical protein
MGKIEKTATTVADTVSYLQTNIGLGLSEFVNRAMLEKIPRAHGLAVGRQKPVPIKLAGIIIGDGAK